MMTGTIRRQRPRRRLARAFLADAKGLAAVELALILPIALMLMSLVVFGGQAFGVQRRVTLAATTVANIFAQANNVNLHDHRPRNRPDSRLSEPHPLPLQR
jgi:Flp pilus assembly protein TadG